MKVRKLLLKDIIDKIDWIILSKGSHGLRKVKDEDVGVAYFTHDKKKYKGIADYLRIRFGVSVLEKLGWKTGDRIILMGDPDDLFSVLLLKSNGPEGRLLTKDANSPTHSLNYKWTRPIQLKPMSLKLVEYDIHEQYIHFRLPSDDEN